jgi:hypothetical protein
MEWIEFIIQIILFIVFIVLGHSFWNYVRDSLSERKKKNVVNHQIEKYKLLLEEIQESKKQEINVSEYSLVPIATNPILPITIDSSIKDDLEQFMNEQIQSQYK